MRKRYQNLTMARKLVVVAVVMVAFGYGMVPLYNAICSVTGVNVLALVDRNIPGATSTAAANSQIDSSRTITVEFDANARGPWSFKPERRSMQVHPGEMATVLYEFQNTQSRRMAAQAIPSYAPRQAGPNFHKLECFCFNQYTLDPGEKKSWPVVFVIDPKISRDVTTITLSYTFFEVGGTVPPAPASAVVVPAPDLVKKAGV